mmetsp:Transcript_27548/g.87213  ORF Transcript_27548/g.87213 Transcript_27548/m.87213 type:complete len:210 (-) Transcript_27548:1865-2494(-)
MALRQRLDEVLLGAERVRRPCGRDAVGDVVQRRRLGARVRLRRSEALRRIAEARRRRALALRFLVLCLAPQLQLPLVLHARRAERARARRRARRHRARPVLLGVARGAALPRHRRLPRLAEPRRRRRAAAHLRVPPRRLHARRRGALLAAATAAPAREVLLLRRRRCRRHRRRRRRLVRHGQLPRWPVEALVDDRGALARRRELLRGAR